MQSGKFSELIRQVKDRQSARVKVPDGDSVKGSPSSAVNADETPEEDVHKNNLPDDIGFCNPQTIAGTGDGAIIN